LLSRWKNRGSTRDRKLHLLRIAALADVNRITRRHRIDSVLDRAPWPVARSRIRIVSVERNIVSILRKRSLAHMNRNQWRVSNLPRATPLPSATRFRGVTASRMPAGFRTIPTLARGVTAACAPQLPGNATSARRACALNARKRRRNRSAEGQREALRSIDGCWAYGASRRIRQPWPSRTYWKRS